MILYRHCKRAGRRAAGVGGGHRHGRHAHIEVRSTACAVANGGTAESLGQIRRGQAGGYCNVTHRRAALARRSVHGRPVGGARREGRSRAVQFAAHREVVGYLVAVVASGVDGGRMDAQHVGGIGHSKGGRSVGYGRAGWRKCPDTELARVGTSDRDVADG